MKTSQAYLGFKGVKNIGPAIAGALHRIGVYTLDDLAALGPLKTYLKLCEQHHGRRLPVCYYLYSLQGALLDLHWNDLPPSLKKQLREQVKHAATS